MPVVDKGNHTETQFSCNFLLYGNWVYVRQLKWILGICDTLHGNWLSVDKFYLIDLVSFTLVSYPILTMHHSQGLYLLRCRIPMIIFFKNLSKILYKYNFSFSYQITLNHLPTTCFFHSNLSSYLLNFKSFFFLIHFFSFVDNNVAISNR